MTDTLTTRDLNRALLARQGLLERQATTPLAMIERVGGLQAQDPRPPFVALWSRLRDFARADLADLLSARQAVRATMMRGTLHIASAADYLAWRMPLAPMLEAGAKGLLKNRGVSYEAEALNRVAAPFFAAEPRRFEDVRQTLVAANPGFDDRAMGYLVRMTLPLVCPPEDADWAFKRDPLFTLAETWLGHAPAPDRDPAAMILRYLAAFGPSTVADAQTWSGLAGLRPAFDALGERLLRFRDERKRELFDLADAPRPDPDTPAPARLVDGFDGVMLGHAERARILDPAHKPLIANNNLRIPPLFLLDGFVAGSWAADATRKTATLTLKPFAALSPKDRKALQAEAEPLLAFIARGAKAREVRVEG